MLRCEKPHRPAAYEPILVRLPQVFGAALKEKAIFSVNLVLKKTAAVFLGIFSIFFLPFRYGCHHGVDFFLLFSVDLHHQSNKSAGTKGAVAKHTS